MEKLIAGKPDIIKPEMPE